MSRTVIAFEVIGEPKPQGSKRAVPIYRGGVPVMKDGRTLTRVIEDNPKLAQWRQEVAHAVRAIYDGPLITGPVQLRLCFGRPRPKSHYGSGRNAGVLKRLAPKYPTSRPDTIKLARAIEDALTGVLWRDDSQIVVHYLEKVYDSHFHVVVEVKLL